MQGVVETDQSFTKTPFLNPLFKNQPGNSFVTVWWSGWPGCVSP